MIKDLLDGKTSKERAEIKAREIAKLDLSGKFTEGDLEIEIISSKQSGTGIELLAKAWKGGKQLGFSKDGSVEIERFRFFNPPILVRDDAGSIERISEVDGVQVVKKYREDLVEATRQSLAHTLKLVAKENTKIIKGKVGNTTSTFFPDPNVESTSVDGRILTDAQVTWATVRGLTTSPTVNDSEAAQVFIRGTKFSAVDFRIGRSFFLFDTSAIPDTDTISSATFSLAALALGVSNVDAGNWDLVASTPASNTAIVEDDYDQLGTTLQATSMALSSWVDTDTTYNDLTLNATGLSSISKTGITKFGCRSSLDTSNTEPTGGNQLGCYFADQAGTSADPKLVVVHSVVVATKPISNLSLLGVG